MARHAIVIGIDSYANEDWNLGASVADALWFAEWVVGPGGVQRRNLRLLLSPKEELQDPIVAYRNADSRTIRETIREFTRGAGAGADRLYVYFGGHGLSAPGISDEPVLIPADVKEIELDEGLLLGFSQVITALSRAEPKEQVFFLDACRDFGLDNFQQPLGRAVGLWLPPRDDKARSRQFILYATSPGQRAYERKALGRGVFTGALLEVLEGKHPEAAPWKPPRYEVSFSSLAEQVRKLVSERLDRMPNAERYVQLPESLSLRGSDVPLVSFRTLPKVRVHVRVGPREARKDCRMRLLTYPPGNVRGRALGDWRGPPTSATTTLEISPGEYGLLAESAGYRAYREPFSVYRAHDFVIDLLELDEGAEPAAAPDASGTLVVTSEDPTAVIAIRNAERQVLESGHGRVEVSDLAAAVYRIHLISVDGAIVEAEAVVRPGKDTTVSLAAPGHRIGSDQIEMLEMLGIQSDDDGYLHPSEHLGGVADPPLASLVAFAAYAAHRPDDGGFKRLRKFGVRSFAKLRRGRAGLLLIVGASGDQPARGVSRDRFLADGEFVVRDLEGVSLGVGTFKPLSGLPAAAQAGLELVPGCLTAELRLPGLAPTRYALATLPDRVTVIIAVARDDGDVEVQQYLLPVRPGEDYLTESPENIRRLEGAQRCYAAQLVVPEGDPVDAHLRSKLLDPILGALAGYSLVRVGRADEYRRLAMRKMLRQFGGLPDSHVLAALCEPNRREKHFTAAFRLGLPVFADGFRALHEWVTQAGQGTDRPLWVQPSLLLPGSAWTAWVASRPVLRVQEGSFERAPVGWDALERKRRAIERTTRSVGRLVPRDGTVPHVATAFLVAPGVAMTMSVALRGRAPSDFLIDFGDGSSGTKLRFDVQELLAAGLPGTPTEFVALVRVARKSRDGAPLPRPLSIAASFPDRAEGREVYAVGFPMTDPRVPEDVQRVLDGRSGAKWVQPGQLLSVSDATFNHDCLTLGGSGGSPVVDLRTGLVIGLHYAGRWVDYKRGEAVALWALRGDALLAQADIRFKEAL